MHSVTEEFSRLSNNGADELKAMGRPIMGWTSIYTPEEIIYAAGIIPFRITGRTTPTSPKSRALLFNNLCPYVLSCLEEGVQNVYDFLDGVVIVNTCDARRRLYDAWRKYVKTPFVHIIDLPRATTPEARKYFKKQFISLKESLENHFDLAISEKSIKDAIVLYNSTRNLLAQLYELRKHKDPPISGVEALSIVRASMAMRKDDFNEKLYKVLVKLGVPVIGQKKARGRVLITGSYFDHIELLELIERLGVNVVCEDVSNGIKYFDGTVNVDKEPLEALADYYLEKAPCARMPDSEKRFKNVYKLSQDYDADAVIYFSLKFCDSNLIDFPYQKNKLNQHGIPVLFLEGERKIVNLQQLKTRIQAFFEMNNLL